MLDTCNYRQLYALAEVTKNALANIFGRTARISGLTFVSIGAPIFTAKKGLLHIFGGRVN